MIEHADIPVILCINKCDVGDASTDALINKYKSIGYHVITTSAINHIGIDELRNHFATQDYCFCRTFRCW